MTITSPTGTPGVDRFTPEQLLRTAHLFAQDPTIGDLVDLTATERTWTRLDATDHLEIWVIGWPAGTTTGWHDHLSSSGAFVVAQGILTESVWGGSTATTVDFTATEGRPFSAQHIHNVSNHTALPALSVHAYGPALRGMTRYALDGNTLRETGIDEERDQW